LRVVPGFLWFLAKVGFFIFSYIWFRSTFPRYRFDQLMSLGWKWLIPMALANILIVAGCVLADTVHGRGLRALGWVFTAFFVILFALSRLRRRLAAAEAR
jgi:hypothetical protein